MWHNGRQKQRAEALEFLGGRCVKCGEDRREVLEFHHKGDKSFTISQRLGRISWRELVEELRKCVLLCSNCHKVVHARGFERI